MNFKDLGVSELSVGILKKMGIHTATPIQEKCIGLIKRGEDVIAQAQTGTGKTLAFLLPMIDGMDSGLARVQGLVVAPTRELALQITQEALKLSEGRNIRVLAAYGGKDIGGQLKKLSGQIHLVIATPGRLLDHLSRGTIDLSGIKTLVLDEADEMLLMGFRNEVEDILSRTPKNHQLLCFSATMSPEVKKLAYRYMHSPIVVAVEEKKVTLETIDQVVVETVDPLKRETLCAVLAEDRPYMAIIFCRTKRRADELEEVMKKRGFDCEKLHSDIAQNKRERIMKRFRKGDLQYLIATDVAARGLDVGGVTHIYNYDIPETPEAYIHRIGRTGRAGEEGQACLFVTPRDSEALAEIEGMIKMRIPRRHIEG